MTGIEIQMIEKKNRIGNDLNVFALNLMGKLCFDNLQHKMVLGCGGGLCLQNPIFFFFFYIFPCISFLVSSRLYVSLRTMGQAVFLWVAHKEFNSD